jgi:hypothetical protein
MNAWQVSESRYCSIALDLNLQMMSSTDTVVRILPPGPVLPICLASRNLPAHCQFADLLDRVLPWVTSNASSDDSFLNRPLGFRSQDAIIRSKLSQH